MNAINTRLLFPVLDNNTPSGGRKFIYHVVDMLNEEGIEAWVVHPYKGFRINWFENKSQVGYMLDLFPVLKNKSWIHRLILKNKNRNVNRYLDNDELATKKLELRETDVLVIPEQRLANLHNYPLQCKKIIFNQNPYFIFSTQFSVGCQPDSNFLGQDILGMLVVSKLNAKIQKYVFPKLDVFEGKLFVESSFNYVSVKKSQISYMPRRGAKDAIAVLNMLRFRGLENEISIMPIVNMSQE